MAKPSAYQYSIRALARLRGDALVAASKQRGMFMGGTPPLGYDVVEKKLVVNPAEADLVREIFTAWQIGRRAGDLVAPADSVSVTFRVTR
jgi:DNA invertase Pin-like site-specific DNA recombinase